jgi:type I restriction enzyme M protein
LKEQILQAKISKEIFLNYENTFNKYKLMNNKIYQENINLQFNELASLKHTLGRPRQNILDWTDNLISFLSSKQNEVVELNKEFKDFYNSSIFDALDEIKSDINFITEVLEKGERGLQMSGKKPVSLFDINKLINKLSINGYNFNIKKILLDNEDLRKRGIECNLILLKTLIENILTNAKKHAFTEIQPKNELIIELIEIDEQLILSIKNNGERFPKNYDKEKFIVKFSTAKNSPGGGIGGYDIHRIASYFGNPDWELLLDEDPLYPVEFRFTFKIIPMEQ